MKNISILIAVFTLFSCNKKEVQLPQSDVSALVDLVDHSPLYMFFEISNEKDTLINVNRQNTISSTNWVFSIDKRLPLRLVIPEVKLLQEKKRSSAHAKADAINVFSYSNQKAKQLAFFPFTDVRYVYDTEFSKFFIKKQAEKYTIFHNFTLNFNSKNELTVDGIKVPKEEFGTYIQEFSDFVNDGKTIMLHLNFDKNLTYGDYLTDKILVWQATSENIQIGAFEFVYDVHQLPECGCTL